MAVNSAGPCCLYQGPVIFEGGSYGGPINLRTKQGFAVIVFAARALAERFEALFSMKGEIIPLASLGTAAYPVNPKPGRPRPKKMIVFSSDEALSAWAEDRQGFDTAPLVSELPPLEEQWPLP